MDPDQQHGQSLSAGLDWSTPSLRMGVRDPVDTTVQDMTRSKALGLTTIYGPPAWAKPKGEWTDSRKPLGHMQRLEVQVKGITGHRIIRSEGEHIFHTSS